MAAVIVRVVVPALQVRAGARAVAVMASGAGSIVIEVVAEH